MKSVFIRSYFGPDFSVFGLITERYSVSLRIQSECGKLSTRITPNTDTFYAVSLTTFSYRRSSLMDDLTRHKAVSLSYRHAKC